MVERKRLEQHHLALLKTDPISKVPLAVGSAGAALRKILNMSGEDVGVFRLILLVFLYFQ